jgi:hypothetical protein
MPLHKSFLRKPEAKMKPMTPARERREQEKLRIAIWRWYRLGGGHDKIIEIADVFYATKIASLAPKIERGD